MAELTPGSVQQLLEVLDRTKRNFKQGVQLPTAYHDAVRDVSHHHGVTYQTIGDLCRRRLAFREIGEFMYLLDRWLRGDADQIRRRIRQRSTPTTHDLIDRFFKTEGPLIGGSASTVGARAMGLAGEPLGIPSTNRTTTDELRLRLTPELRQRLQLAYLAKVGSTLEDTAIALMQSGFEAQKAKIRDFLESAVGTA